MYYILFYALVGVKFELNFQVLSLQGKCLKTQYNLKHVINHITNKTRRFKNEAPHLGLKFYTNFLSRNQCCGGYLVVFIPHKCFSYTKLLFHTWLLCLYQMFLLKHRRTRKLWVSLMLVGKRVFIFIRIQVYLSSSRMFK